MIFIPIFEFPHFLMHFYWKSFIIIQEILIFNYYFMLPTTLSKNYHYLNSIINFLINFVRLFGIYYFKDSPMIFAVNEIFVPHLSIKSFFFEYLKCGLKKTYYPPL
jgi:hypothetical protein